MKKAIHIVQTTRIIAGKFVPETERREVTVMCQCNGYAMVRRKGAMPYVANEKELEPIE